MAYSFSLRLGACLLWRPNTRSTFRRTFESLFVSNFKHIDDLLFFFLIKDLLICLFLSLALLGVCSVHEAVSSCAACLFLFLALLGLCSVQEGCL